MNEFIEKYSKEKNITSKYSLASMKSNLRRVEKIIDKNFDDWEVDDFKDHEKIIDDLTDKYQLNTVIVTLNAIKVWLIINKKPVKIIEEYGEIIKELGRLKDNTVKEQKKTDVEEELGKDFNFDNMREKIRDYVEENYESSKGTKLKDLLLVSLFSLQPPARIGNYLNMEIKQGVGSSLPKDKNYLMKNKGEYKFIFNKYKTAKHIGQVELEVKDELLKNVITKYLKNIPGDQEELFESDQSKVTSALIRATKKIFDVGFSLNVFRHSFLTEFLGKNPSIIEKEYMAKIIGQKYEVPRMEKYSRIE
tara:strand:+ start:742 stop:1659 length:918 start_codon:yes stop_codon:yes gene_type:complete